MRLEVEPQRPATPPPPPRPHYDDDDEESHRSRKSPLLWLVGVLLICGLGYGGWQGYQMMQGTPSASTEVPLFAANDEPFKEVPDDPGGDDIPNQGLLVLEDPITGEESNDLEVLLPEPEEPMAVEADDGLDDEGIIDVEASGVATTIEGVETDPLFSADEVSTFMQDVLTEAAPASAMVIPLPTEKPVAPEAPAQTVVVLNDGASTEVVVPEEGDGLSFADVAAAVNSGTVSETTVPGQSATDAEGTTTELAALPASDTVVRVQIAAYSTGDAATAAWDRLYINHQDLLADVDALILEAFIGDATFYRLQVGAYERKADADALCASLKQRDIDCLVVGP